MLRTLLLLTILARAIAESAGAGARRWLCVAIGTLGLPAALDAAITGPADKDRACMRALLIPDARITSSRSVRTERQAIRS